MDGESTTLDREWEHRLAPQKSCHTWLFNRLLVWLAFFGA
jgi:hypothetical protein